MSTANTFAILVCASALACDARDPVTNSRRDRSPPPPSATWKKAAVEVTVVEESVEQDHLLHRIAEAARRAGALWSASCATPRITVRGPTRSRVGVGRDGVNVVVVRNKVWCHNGRRKGRCYNSHELAMTTVYLSNDSTGHSGRFIEEADVELNAVHYDWLRTEPLKSPAPVSLASVLLHEFGHVLGLQDVVDASDEPRAMEFGDSQSPSIMSSDALVRLGFEPRGPSPLDLAALCSAYEGRAK